MKTKTIHMTLALLTIAGASAQPPGTGEGRRPPPPPPFAFFDADRDGTLSAGEIQNASAALAKLDKNGDGSITKDEMRPPKPENGNMPPQGNGPQGNGPQGNGPQGNGPQGNGPQGNGPQGDGPQGPPPQGMRPVPPLIAALDTDKDGSISAEELKAASESLKTLDKNGNGKLDREELRPPHGPPPPEGGQDGIRPEGPPPE